MNWGEVLLFGSYLLPLVVGIVMGNLSGYQRRQWDEIKEWRKGRGE